MRRWVRTTLAEARVVTGATKETFYRFIATIALVVVGALAWYGLHRDIQENKNPCFTEPTGRACESYACNIGHILGVQTSPICADLLDEPIHYRGPTK